MLIEKDKTNCNLGNATEQWLEKLRYKKKKVAKCEEIGRRKWDNIMFQREQKGFFRMLEGEKAHEVEIPEMEKFVEFWALGKRRKNAKHTMDGRDKETIK